MYHDLTKGSISRSLLLFALPMMAGNLLQQFYNITDTLIVGRVLGKNALAAVGSSYTLMTFLTSIFLGLSMGSGALFSIYRGKGDERALKSSIAHACGLILAVTLVLNAVVYIFIDPILSFLRVPEEVWGGMREYLLIIFADDVFIYAVVNLMNTPFSGFFLISVIGACVSTANSQLHLIGCMLSYDVAAQITKKKMSEEQILILARVFIFIGGTAALILSVNPPEDMLSFGADIWGLFSAALAPLIYGGLYWKRRTKAGAVGAFFTGLICSVLFWKMDLQIYWAFPATLCAAAVYVVIPMFEKKRGAEE